MADVALLTCTFCDENAPDSGAHLAIGPSALSCGVRKRVLQHGARIGAIDEVHQALLDLLLFLQRVLVDPLARFGACGLVTAMHL